MAKKFIKKLTKKGSAIRYQFEIELSNTKFLNLLEYLNHSSLLSKLTPYLRNKKVFKATKKNILVKYFKWLKIKQQEKNQEDLMLLKLIKN